MKKSAAYTWTFTVFNQAPFVFNLTFNSILKSQGKECGLKEMLAFFVSNIIDNNDDYLSLVFVGVHLLY